MQIQLFEPVGYGIAERIRSLKLDELRPIEALQLLSELQKELKAVGQAVPPAHVGAGHAPPNARDKTWELKRP